jgi:hypothetical protein
VTSGTFRDLLGEPGCVVIPAVYDALSARIAERLGFRAVGLGGFLVAASRLGGPDVGQLTMSEIVEHVRGVAAAVSLPVLADGDTGYGNPLNVRRTVQAYEAGGAQAIVLEGFVLREAAEGEVLVEGQQTVADRGGRAIAPEGCQHVLHRPGGGPSAATRTGTPRRPADPGASPRQARARRAAPARRDYRSRW